MEYELLIKHYRTLRNMTQTELAKRTGYNQSYISSLEKGKKSPTIRVIFHIAKILNVCPHLLINYDKKCCNDCSKNCEFDIT